MSVWVVFVGVGVGVCYLSIYLSIYRCNAIHTLYTLHPSTTGAAISGKGPGRQVSGVLPVTRCWSGWGARGTREAGTHSLRGGGSQATAGGAQGRVHSQLSFHTIVPVPCYFGLYSLPFSLPVLYQFNTMYCFCAIQKPIKAPGSFHVKSTQKKKILTPTALNENWFLHSVS